MKQKISTLQTIYREGKEQLELSGVPDADLDAWYLLEFVTGISKARYYGNPEAGMEEEEVLRYQDVIRQRAERIPLQHITGEQEFMGFSFQVNEHVLIPRQDTETLVEEALGVLKPKMEILDLCTGSGCILLSLLKLGEKQGIAGLKGTGADISREALKVAEENGRRLEIPGDQLAWVRGDLFEKLEGPFDLLVSNPPYIPSGELSGLQEEVRLHDPALALDGHEDGLYFYRRIAAEAGKYLRDGAFLMLEIGWDQGAAVKALMEENGFHEVRVTKDYAGLDRVVSGVWF